MRDCLFTAAVIVAIGATVLASYLLGAYAMAYMHGGELRGIAAVITRK